ERGVVADGESRMIQSVVELGGTTAREVMTPRPEMVWIEVDKTVGQASRLAVRSGYSRIPVVGENADDVVGVLYLRDLVARLDHPDGRAAAVSDVMRPAMFVPDAKRIDDLLAEMQDRKSTRLNSSHVSISYAVFCLKKKKIKVSDHNKRYLME